MIRLLFSISLFLLGFMPSIAQETRAGKPQLRFQHLMEGLNNEKITAIHQDQWGFIWIGTFNGLHRYDGLKFKLYLSTKEENSLPSSRIEKIYSDSKGNLWIGTSASVCRYNRSLDTFKRYTLSSGQADASDPTPNRVRAIVEDEEGTLWVGSEREGLFYLDEKKQEFTAYVKGQNGSELSDHHVTELCLGKANDLWIGYTTGLDKLNRENGKVTSFPHQPEHSHNIAGLTVRGMTLDEQGDLWVGTTNSGLFRLKAADQDAKRFELFSHDPENPNSLGNNSIYFIFLDRQQRLWVGNENGGFHLFNRPDNSFHRYMPDARDPFSISSNSIWSMCDDKQGRIWVGTGLKGVNIVDKQYIKFTHYYSSPFNPQGLNNNLVRGFREDKQGNVWIATDGGGLNYWNRSSDIISHYTHNPKDPTTIGSDALLDFTEDAEGRLWIATWAGGINILADPQKMHFRRLQDLYPDDAFASQIASSFGLHTDRKGNVWSASFQHGLGFHNRETGTTQLFSNDPKNPGSISYNLLFAVFEDSEGNIWAGGEDEGLNRMNPQADGQPRFVRYLHDAHDSTSLAGNLINQIFEDSKQQVWIATSGGLSRYVKETDAFVNYTTEQGLPSDFVASIVEDSEGVLWIGTEKGLSKYDPVKNTFRNYTSSDGLQGEKFSRHSVVKLSSGEFMFGGSNGFNIFHPEKVEDNPYKPEVYITDLKLFNKSVSVGDHDSLLRQHISLTKEIILDYSQNVIGFEFVGLNYTHPTKNQYAYMLEGLEEGWNYVGTLQVATYTNLDPGQYTFRVKASNNDGLWNEEGATIIIRVLPPWYRTWWFYGLLCLGVGAVFYAFIKWREKRLKEDKAILASSIAAKAQELEDKQAEMIAREEADKIRNWTAQGLNQFSQTVNKHKDDIGQLAQSLLSQLIKFIGANQGIISILNEDDEDDRYLEVIATYAQEEVKRASIRFDLEESMLGVCFSSGEVMYIDNLPEGYSNLSSGLGETKMTYLLLVPLRLDDFVVGVIELCSFHPFQEHQIQFLKKLGEIITSSLYTLKVNRTTSALLDKAKEQARELQAQEEEIRLNIEELQATQEDFYRREQELQEKLNALEAENQQLKGVAGNKKSKKKDV